MVTGPVVNLQDTLRVILGPPPSGTGGPPPLTGIEAPPPSPDHPNAPNPSGSVNNGGASVSASLADPSTVNDEDASVDDKDAIVSASLTDPSTVKDASVSPGPPKHPNPGATLYRRAPTSHPSVSQRRPSHDSYFVQRNAGVPSLYIGSLAMLPTSHTSFLRGRNDSNSRRRSESTPGRHYAVKHDQAPPSLPAPRKK